MNRGREEEQKNRILNALSTEARAELMQGLQKWKSKDLELECHICGQRLVMRLGEPFEHACTGFCDTRGYLLVTLRLPEVEPKSCS